MKKHAHICKSIIFILLLTLVLGLISQASILMSRDKNPLYNYAARELLNEPKHTIDVLAIGSSDVYSGISPLEWWNTYGISGYSWGEASERISETHNYLKKIYKKQSPKVVFLEIGMIYRDKTAVSNIDSMVKADAAQIFPVITYHRYLEPHRLQNLTADSRSLTKGYCIRNSTQSVSGKSSYMKKARQKTDIHPIAKWELKRCIDLCHKNGSEVVLLSVPSYFWNMKKHNGISDIAEEYDVPYLDLNLKLDIDWKTETADAGTHLNYKGAKKVSDYLGKYLDKHYDLTDHRGESDYAVWDQDYEAYHKEMKKISSSH